MKNIVLGIIIVVLLVIVVGGAAFTINEREQGVVLQFGKPVATYKTPGIYTVSLEAKHKGGSDTETKTGYIIVTAP